ncbi:unnamed protein product [Coccothraustes coccothraustes]
MQSRAARQELREARCLGQPRWLLELCAGLAQVHWLLQPLRLRRVAPAHPRRWAEGTPRKRSTLSPPYTIAIVLELDGIMMEACFTLKRKTFEF